MRIISRPEGAEEWDGGLPLKREWELTDEESARIHKMAEESRRHLEKRFGKIFSKPTYAGDMFKRHSIV